MPQSDGTNELVRISLQMLGEDGTDVTYNFRVNPENYVESFPQRTTVYKTRSAVVIEDFGPDLGQITFSGTTGFKSVNGVNGAQRMASLKKFLQDYSKGGHASTSDYLPERELYFHNNTDDKSYLVHIAPEGFSITRSSERSLLFQYSISLVVLRETSDPDPRAIDETMTGNMTTENKIVATGSGNSIAVNPNSSEPLYDIVLDKAGEIIGYRGQQKVE